MYPTTGVSLVAQMVKNLPAMRETWVLSLGWEDPLDESMATHSNILAWRIPWTEESGGIQSTGGKELDTTELYLLITYCAPGTILETFTYLVPQ